MPFLKLIEFFLHFVFCRHNLNLCAFFNAVVFVKNICRQNHYGKLKIKSEILPTFLSQAFINK